MAVVGHPPPTIYDPISTASSMGSDDGIDSFFSDVGDFGQANCDFHGATYN